MRAVFWLCVFLSVAGGAQACASRSHTSAQAKADGATQIAGGIWLPPRPSPGSTLRTPDFTWPVIGPHGGQVADARTRGKAG